MKKRLLAGLLIMASMFLGIKVSAIDYNSYLPFTIQDVACIAEGYGSAEPGYKDRANSFLFAPMIPFRTEAKFLGEIRPLSPVHLFCLETLQKSRPDIPFTDLYKREIFIADSDGREYWLPIQETHLDSFQKEYQPDCRLTLYLVWVLNFDHQPFVLINEFVVSK